MKSKYQRRHYEDFAAMLGRAFRDSSTDSGTVAHMQDRIERLFEDDNTHFDVYRFRAAITKATQE